MKSTAAFDFQHDVIDASAETPIVVDFWAPWCGPCRALGPVLERLDAETDDWRLVKVNTDEHPHLSQQYGIRGIPAVKLFVDGQVVGEFTGVLPEPAIRQWLDEYLPSPAKTALALAEELLRGGERDAARRGFEAVLALDPDNPQARTRLAALTVFDEPQRALDLLGSGAFAGAEYVQQEEAVRTIAALLASDPADLPDTPLRARFTDALAALRTGDMDTALEHLIAVVQTDRAYAARKAAIALFHLLGPEHPATQRWRRRFDMAMY